MSEIIKKAATKEFVKALYDDLRERVDDVESSTESIAPNYYDLTLPILVGTDCIYEDERYICNTQINTSESFTPAHWTKQTVCESISLVKNDIEGIILLESSVIGASSTVTKDGTGRITGVTYTIDGNTVRTDTITYGNGTITEVRTDGEKTVTITTNLSTLAQTVEVA